MDYYTYAHIRKDTGKIFYVGKGCGQRAWIKSGRSDFWNRISSKHGFNVEILARWNSEYSALQHETFLIDVLRQSGVVLCNITLGGEGVSGLRHKDDTKERISKSLVGRPKSDEAREKMSKARIGMKFSEEHRKSMSLVRIGKPGRPHTEESKAKLVAAKLGKPGHIPSAESREKKSAAMKATIARKKAEGIEHKMPTRIEWTPERRAAMAEKISKHWAEKRGAEK